MVAIRAHSRLGALLTDEEIVKEVRRGAMTADVPGLTVQGAEAQLRDDLDPDEPVVGLVVTLADPLPGQDTWPLDAVQELRQAVRRSASQAGVPYSLSVQVRSASDTSAAEADDCTSDLAERLPGGASTE